MRKSLILMLALALSLVACTREVQNSLDVESEKLPAIQNEDIPPLAKPTVNLGDIITFGEYAWRILDVKENKVFIISENVIAFRAYNDIIESVTWETCSLREYLNNDFYNQFSDEEKSRIIETNVVNEDTVYPNKTLDGGNDTTDNIFLLSISEAKQFFAKDSARIGKDLNGNDRWWWLRSPCGAHAKDNSQAALVTPSGSVDDYTGIRVDLIDDRGASGIRPAMWINDDNLIHGFIADTNKAPVLITEDGNLGRYVDMYKTTQVISEKGDVRYIADEGILRPVYSRQTPDNKEFISEVCSELYRVFDESRNGAGFHFQPVSSQNGTVGIDLDGVSADGKYINTSLIVIEADYSIDEPYVVIYYDRTKKTLKLNIEELHEFAKTGMTIK